MSELARVTRLGGRLFVADQLGSIDPPWSMEMDRFERLRDASHQRLLPDGDIRGYLDANDLRAARVRGDARAGRPGAPPRPRRHAEDRPRKICGPAGRRALRGRDRRTPPQTRPPRSSLVPMGGRAGGDPCHEPGQERPRDRDGGAGTTERSPRPCSSRRPGRPPSRRRRPRSRSGAGTGCAASRAAGTLDLDEAGSDRGRGCRSTGAAPPSSARTRAARFAAA